MSLVKKYGMKQGFGSRSDSSFQISLDPDPGFKFLWIRIRFQHSDTDPDPRQKKSAESALKVINQKRCLDPGSGNGLEKSLIRIGFVLYLNN